MIWGAENQIYIQICWTSCTNIHKQMQTEMKAWWKFNRYNGCWLCNWNSLNLNTPTKGNLACVYSKRFHMEFHYYPPSPPPLSASQINSSLTLTHAHKSIFVPGIFSTQNVDSFIARELLHLSLTNTLSFPLFALSFLFLSGYREKRLAFQLFFFFNHKYCNSRNVFSWINFPLKWVYNSFCYTLTNNV